MINVDHHFQRQMSLKTNSNRLLTGTAEVLCMIFFLYFPGLTHRSNQVSGPEYIFLISSLAGERRFASTVSKRLESLGALTHGDRRATDSRDLSQFNIDNKVRE